MAKKACVIKIRRPDNRNCFVSGCVQASETKVALYFAPMERALKFATIKQASEAIKKSPYFPRFLEVVPV